MMKRLNKIIITGVLILIAIIKFTSCSDSFLNEENTTQYNTAYLKTEQGLTQLAVGLYENIRWHFSGEWAIAATSYGTDEFTTANDLSSEPWNVYDSRFQPINYTTAVGAPNNNCPGIDAIWNEMYFGIASANILIANADNISDVNLRNKCLGEAYFLRGYNYYRLFAQYGGVVLQTKPLDGVVRNFKRSSEEESMAQIIIDLNNAYKLLPITKWRGYGTWTKYTAAHFLAKALLFRSSERNDSWNTNYISNDLDTIIKLCDEVIAACPLANNYNQLFGEWTGIDCANEGLNEILMSAQFNGDASAEGSGNKTYPYFTSQFSNYSGGFVKRGIWVGLDYQRCRPTEYNYSSFDNVNDSRLWKSFKTVYGANVYPSAYNTKNNSFGSSAMALGDQAIIYILNKKSDTRFDSEPYGKFGRPATSTFINPETNKWVPCAFLLYLNGQYVMPNYGVSGNPVTSNVFCGINKMEDGSRTAEKGNAHRDGIMARTGETYLIKAEAQVRQGKYQDAITTINIIRQRAQWKEGENREYYADGTKAFTKNSLYADPTNKNYYDYAYIPKNTYYLSTGVANTTTVSDLQISSYTLLPAEDEVILTTLQCNTDKDRMLNFIMNERTRELDGEFLRWEDLSRTKLLIRRVKAFNAQAATNITDKHLLRPIPQSFIDALLNDDGSKLTDDQRKALQNPEY